MASVLFSNLSQLQANAICMMLEEEDNLLDLINAQFGSLDLPKLDSFDIHYDKNGDNIATANEADDFTPAELDEPDELDEDSNYDPEDE